MFFGGWMMIVWVVVAGLIVWAVIAITRRGSAPSEHKAPLDIAKERYARGEISKEEFERIMKDLTG